MRWRTAGWAGMWLILALYLLVVVGALALTWLIGAAEERYISGFGVDVGVSARFSDGGRWLVSALLGVLALLGLVGAAWLLAARRLRPRRAVPDFAAGLDALAADPAVRTPPPAALESRPYPAEQTTARYRAALVGDEPTRRSERAVPPAGGESALAAEPRPEAGEDVGGRGETGETPERTPAGR